MTTIIVEGIDGTGKSRLCDALCREFKWPINIIGPAPKTPDDLTFYILSQTKLANSGDVIFDRCTALSQYVYDGVFGEGQFSRVMLNEAAGLLTRPDVVVVYCSTRKPIHNASDYDTQDMLKKIDIAQNDLRLRYENALNVIQCNHLTYDMTKDADYRQVIAQIKEAINHD